MRIRKIKCTLTKRHSISAAFVRNRKISASVRVSSRQNAESYTGSYEITPDPFKEQRMETKHKLMQDDVVVHIIPYESVSNEEGGRTVTIGGY